MTHVGALALGALIAQLWPLLQQDDPVVVGSDVEVVTHRVSLPDAPDGFRLERFREGGRARQEASVDRTEEVVEAPSLAVEAPAPGERLLTRTPPPGPVEDAPQAASTSRTEEEPGQRRLERSARVPDPEPRAETPAAAPTAERRAASDRQGDSGADAEPRREREASVRTVERAPGAQPVEVSQQERASEASPEDIAVDVADTRSLAAAGGSGASGAQGRVVRRGAPSEPWFEVVIHASETVDQAREIERRLQEASLPAGVITVVDGDGNRQAQVVLRARGDADSRQDMVSRAQAVLRQ